MVRKVAGVLLGLIGLVVAAAGGAAAFWLIGPDDTVRSGEQHLSSKGLAIATTPELLDRHGPTLHIDVRSTNNQPVFVGVARDFDVASYLDDIGHTKLVQVQYPIALTTQDENGTAGPLAAPATLDWWITKANGTGTQSIAWPIEDGPHDVVIMNADGNTSPDVQVTLGIEIPHAFHTALTVFAIGIVLLTVGILLVLIRRRPAAPTLPPQTAPPSQQPQSAAGTLRRMMVTGLAFAVLTGCAAVPQPDTVQTLTRPAISNAAAVAVIKHYSAVNNKASAARDDNLIATVEAGDRLRQSQAGFKIDRAAKVKPGAPYTHTNPVIGAPEFGGYPMRFVSSAGYSDTKAYRHLGLWERASAGSPWKLVFSAAPKATVRLPDLPGIRPAAKADDAKLAIGAQAAASTLATYLTGGAGSSHAATFQPNAEITSTLATIAMERAENLKDRKSVRSVTNEFTAAPDSPAFVTTAGTAVVFVSLTHEFRMMVGENWEFWWETSPETAFSPPTAKYGSAVNATTLYDAALLIPPKGKGKVQVLSFESQLVDAGGY